MEPNFVEDVQTPSAMKHARLSARELSFDLLTAAKGPGRGGAKSSAALDVTFD